jgi:uncharacterized membrane protein YhaH (DUF805 family)
MTGKVAAEISRLMEKGDYAEALSMLAPYTRSDLNVRWRATALYEAAVCHCRLGNPDLAFQMLEQAVSTHEEARVELLTSRDFELLAGDPRLAALRQRCLDRPTSFLHTLFSFSGRITRRRYCGGIAAMVAVEGVGLLLLGATIGRNEFLGFLLLVAGFVTLLWMSLAVAIKRLQDIGAPTWAPVLLFIPFFNIIVAACLAFIPGTPGINEHGADPRQRNVQPNGQATAAAGAQETNV